MGVTFGQDWLTAHERIYLVAQISQIKLFSSPQFVDEPYLLVVIIHFLVIYAYICSSNPIKSTCFILVPQNDLRLSWLNPTLLYRRLGCRPAWLASRMRRTMPRRVTMRLTIMMNHTGLICLLLF